MDKYKNLVFILGNISGYGFQTETSFQRQGPWETKMNLTRLVILPLMNYLVSIELLYCVWPYY